MCQHTHTHTHVQALAVPDVRHSVHNVKQSRQEHGRVTTARPASRCQMCRVHAAGGSTFKKTSSARSVGAERAGVASEDLVSAPFTFPLILPSLRTDIMHDIRASGQLCTAVARV